MSTRAVLSYDDITEPILPIPSETSVPKSIDGPPTKRPRWAKTNNARGQPAKRARARLHHHVEAHWDSSTEPTSIVSYDPIDSIPPPPPPTSASNHHPLSLGQSSKSGPSSQQQQQKRNAVNGNFKNDQERYVSIGEMGVWDDSSLIEAWEAANDEYERLNGPGKSWKDIPIVKSNLWYGTNTSNSKTVKDESLEEAESSEQGHEGERRLVEGEDHPEQVPIDKDNTALPTFPDITQFTTQNVSDYTTHEVFQQAVNSAWWLGYWTALHQMKVSSPPEESDPT